jgi:hypothetical protein
MNAVRPASRIKTLIGSLPASIHAHHYDTTIRKPVEVASDRLSRETDGIALPLAPVSAAVTFGYVCYYLLGLKAFRVRRTSGG